MGIHPPESFGRIHHLPKQRLAAVMDSLRERGRVHHGCFAGLTDEEINDRHSDHWQQRSIDKYR
jgi:hypothetical protein